MNTNALADRLPRVLRFDTSVYREIAADSTAMPQAGLVVILAALLNAIGQTLEIGGILVLTLLSVIAFFIYTAVATAVSRGLFQGRTDFNEMGRTLGYSYAWYALGILALIPLGGILAFLGWLAAIVAGVIALRESSEFDTVKAVVTVVIAAVIAALLNAIVAGPILALFGAQ